MKQIRKGTRVHTGYGKGVVVKRCAAWPMRFVMMMALWV